MNYSLFTFFSPSQLLERYQLSHLNSYSSYINDDTKPLIAVYEGDLTLDDFDLDFPEDSSQEQPVGFLITGNLVVNGNITNEGWEYSLVVLGNLYANNIAICGLELYVRGNVTVDDVFCGYYYYGENYDALFIDGDVTAKLLISSNYRFWIKGHLQASIASTGCDEIGLLEGRTIDMNYDDDYDDESGIGCGGARWIEGDIPVIFTLVEECREDDWERDETSFDFYTLIKRLRDGLPIIHPDGIENSPQLTAWRKANDLYQQAQIAYYDDDNERAMRLYEEAGAMDVPGDTKRWSRYKRANYYYNNGEYDKAVPLLTWCIEHDMLVFTCLINRASSRMHLVEEDENSKENNSAIYAAARADCQQVIDNSSDSNDNANAYNLIGYSLYQEAYYEEALIPLFHSLEFEKEQYNANLNIGICLWELDRNTEAIPYLDKAIKADPDATYPINIKGDCCYEIDEYKIAAEAYLQYLETSSLDEITRIKLIDCLVKLNRLDEARIQAVDLLKHYPDDEWVNADGYMAAMLRHAKRPKEALKYAIDSTKINPELGHHFVIKGICCYDMKDVECARATWKAYVDAYPEDKTAWYLLAVTYKWKDKAMARSYLDKALAIDSEYEDALQYKEYLAKPIPSFFHSFFWSVRNFMSAR
jgi:tetratricopeptide (TPR) repeat protein